MPLLRDIHIVDTPGTNAIVREHERITAEFVPRSDLVLFVTSADRPFTGDRACVPGADRGWGKKVVAVINKIDILESDAQVDEVTTFVARTRTSLLGFDPDIFPSEREARTPCQGQATLRSGTQVVSRRWSATSRDTLDAPGRIQLKLLNPLGVAASLAEKHAGVVRERLALLQEDFATLDDVERQLGIYQKDLSRDLDLRMADIDRILLQMERRGHDYFDETMRIGRVMDLLNRSRVQQGFRAAGRRRRPAEDRTEDWRARGLARRHGPSAVAAGQRASGRAQAAAPFPHRREMMRADSSTTGRGSSTRLAETRSASSIATAGVRPMALADGARNAVAAAAAVSAGAVGFRERSSSRSQRRPRLTRRG